MSLDLDRAIAQLYKCEVIKEVEVKELCTKAKEVLLNEPNMPRVEAPVTVYINKKNSINYKI
jgi:serine/threonine-protein phosphatase 4 catalytic subunit